MSPRVRSDKPCANPALARAAWGLGLHLRSAKEFCLVAGGEGAELTDGHMDRYARTYAPKKNTPLFDKGHA